VKGLPSLLPPLLFCCLHVPKGQVYKIKHTQTWQSIFAAHGCYYKGGCWFCFTKTKARQQESRMLFSLSLSLSLLLDSL
jgi:hypothetical protein